MIAAHRPIDKVVDFLTSIPQPKEILAYRPDSEDSQRYQELSDKNKIGTLNQSEREELDSFLFIEHIMVVAKKRATLKLREG